MRFLDLLLTLIFQGRDALPKSTVTRTVTTLSNPVTNALAPGTELAGSKSKGTTTITTTTTNTTVSSSKQRSESLNEKFYRQLIEWIRVNDTESLVEAFETNPIDLNFMDDAGQTLLNWAAAFGGAEMVDYLATKGIE
jgi:ankyrin repeat protein